MDELKKLFEYFEDADEAVYVSDADSYELIYMNESLKELLGYDRSMPYQGKKCYKVLQNQDAPCEFCNNKRLRSSGSLFWAHDNLILDRRFLVRDKMLECNGRRYRIETAKNQSRSGMERARHELLNRETIVNECFQIFFTAPNPEQSIKTMLGYLGAKFGAHRAYLFEIFENRTISNTYEWCADGVASQMEFLHDLPLSDLQYWMESFSRENTILIRDIEEIHQKYPSTYSLLKPQGIQSLVAGPIREKGELRGFLGLDNPEKEMLFLLEQVVGELGKYLFPQLKRRDMYQRFRQMSYHDMLTGAYNHNAMQEHTASYRTWNSFGAIYCDINGLKETNRTQGYEAGNELIRRCYRLMQHSLHTKWIYRVGGDEFVALYRDTDRSTIEQDLDALRLHMLQSTCQLSIGGAWSDEAPIDVETVLTRANDSMYRARDLRSALMQGSGLPAQSGGCSAPENTPQGVLQRFLSNTYCDVAFLLSVLGQENKTSYFFFGDIQQRIYYISENMRIKFGFSSNIISDPVKEWGVRIEDPELRERFERDVDALLHKKQKYHDLRYQVQDANGNRIWVRCYGQIKWSEDGTTPLFFAGRMSQQDEDFVVDPLTNLPTEPVLVKQLEKNKELKRYDRVIGFSLHNIMQINNNHGRDYGDNLICEIAGKLTEALAHEITLFRLSGTRFLGLLDAKCPQSGEELIEEIRRIVDKVYHSMGIATASTCSFVLLRCLPEDVMPQDLIENVISLSKVANQTPDQPFLDDSVGSLQKIKQVASMESRLIENVLHGMENFRIVIQPVVSAQTGLPVGGETLLRWQYNGQNVSPATFIPIIEREQMIHLAGRWVFEQAVRACVRLTTLMENFYLTVNVSLQQLSDEGLIPFLRETLQKYQLGGEHIVLELTESCMDSQPEKLDRFVEECTKLNIRIALDDFGSGYSSLRVLLRYPSNIIKLDRSLLLEMSDSSEKSSFITSIVYACHQFGKKVCMEGVETEFQRELVQKAGCDLIQGFYYYKPMELDNVYHLIGGQQG